jgi:hypothetical protein
MSGETLAAIVAADESGGVVSTTLELIEGEWPSEPLAPATLWTATVDPILELHKLVRREGKTATFETYGVTEAPKSGGPYRLFSWWRPEQYELAADGRIEWRLATVPTDADDLDCALTWARLRPGETAYVAPCLDEWISVDAYQRYIREDLLRMQR